MFMKILAASAFTVALATSAMAQSAAGTDGSSGSGKSVTVDPSTPASANPVDPATTNSTTTAPTDMNSNADKNCPTSPQGAQSDANGNATAPTVNDKNCGK
ncbi:hypothetical protein [Mesorhizobium erdmanii]|uniref:hypothetical protein n=1 Tax=Mesorhizobium erdmanii TaxID=1777866 RepID=UPI0004182D7D|nr:hypothetical protein [Mesorhizobium erdmanii]